MTTAAASLTAELAHPRTPGGEQSPLPLLVTPYGMPSALRTAIGAGPVSLAHTQLFMRAPGAAAATRPRPGGSFRTSLFRFLAWPIIRRCHSRCFSPRISLLPNQTRQTMLHQFCLGLISPRSPRSTRRST